MIDQQAKRPYECQCRHCVEQPPGSTAAWHRQINQVVVRLNEKHRRQFVGLLARQLGRGGVSQMAQITGLSRNTISRGQQELAAADDSNRIRAKGGGRRLTEKKHRACCWPWKR
jgi:hypothetical protein